MGWDCVTAFWAKTKISGDCIIWKGKLFPNGYGCVRRRYRDLLAHRYAYEISKGNIPVGLLVCHSCDNRRCVNPEHLWLGTQKDNLQDAKRKGRLKRSLAACEKLKITVSRGDGHWTKKHPESFWGEKNPSAKLNLATVIEIRRAHKNGEGGYISLARRFGSTKSNVEGIIKRNIWAWVPAIS